MAASKFGFGAVIHGLEITRSRVGDARSARAASSEGEGLASDRTHPLSLSDTNTPRVAIGSVTRIRCNVLDADEDTGSA